MGDNLNLAIDLKFALDDEDAPAVQALKDLDETTRIQLIVAWLTKDPVVVIKTLVDIGIYQNLSPPNNNKDAFEANMDKFIREKKGSIQENKARLILISSLITRVLASDLNDTASNYSALQTNDEIETQRQEILLARIFKLIPDDKVKPSTKLLIATTVDPQFSTISQFPYLFVAGPKEDTPQFTKINVDQYKAAMPYFDQSDFIINSMALLLSQPEFLVKAKGNLGGPIKNIYEQYFALNYKQCIEDIKALTMSQNNPNVTEAIENAAVQAKPVEPDKTFSRRVFETDLARYAIGDQECLNELATSLQNICKNFDIDTAELGLDLENSENLHIKIQELVNILSKTSNHPDEIGDKATILKNDLDWLDKIYTHKPGMTTGPYNDNNPRVPTVAASLEGGIVKATQPSTHEYDPRATTINSPVDKSVSEKTDPTLNPNAPFVKGLSGHAFTLAAILLHHIEISIDELKQEKMGRHSSSSNTSNNSDNSDLEASDVTGLLKDIENLIKAAIITQTLHGYHSMHEVLDIFKDPRMHQEFMKHFDGIIQDYKVERALQPQFNAALLQKAVFESVNYTLTICLGRSLNQELKTPAKLQHVEEAKQNTYAKTLQTPHHFVGHKTETVTTTPAVPNPAKISSSPSHNHMGKK